MQFRQNGCEHPDRIPNLRSETVEELVSASLQVLDEMAPVRRSDANAAHGDYKLALQLKTAQGEATREAIRRQEEDAKIGLEIETIAHAEDDLGAPSPYQQRQQQAYLCTCCFQPFYPLSVRAYHLHLPSLLGVLL